MSHYIVFRTVGDFDSVEKRIRCIKESLELACKKASYLNKLSVELYKQALRDSGLDAEDLDAPLTSEYPRYSVEVWEEYIVKTITEQELGWDLVL
jgi:hypothetical protein